MGVMINPFDGELMPTPNSAQLAASGGATAKIQKIKRLMRVAQKTNPLLDPVTSDIASLTVSTTATSGLTSWPIQTYPGRYTTTGGRLRAREGGATPYVFFPVSDRLGATNGNLAQFLASTPTYSSWGSATVSFRTAATEIDLAVNGSTSAGLSTGFRVLVDGKYYSKTITPFVDGNGTNYVNIKFNSRKSRVITYEVPPGYGFYYAATFASETIQAVKPADKFIALVTGDSFSEAQGATAGQYGHFNHVKHHLGITDIRPVAVGGCGWLANNGGVRSTIRQQMATWLTVNSDLTAADIDIIYVCAGLNDAAGIGTGDYTLAQVLAEANTCLTEMRQRFSSAMIIVVGPWGAATGPSANNFAIEAGLKAIVDGGAISNIYFIPFCGTTAAEAVLNGTQYQRAATITIANPGVVTSTAHPWANGNRVQLYTTGAVPTGYNTTTAFYIVNATTNTFQLSLTSGGDPIVTTGTQSGSHFVYRVDTASTSSANTCTDGLHPSDLGHEYDAMPIIEGSRGIYADLR